MRVRDLLALCVVGLSFVACGGTTAVPTQPSSPMPDVTPPIPLATYAVTFTASASCASQLPADLRIRQYVAKLFANGSLNWSGQFVHQPSGHNLVSSGKLSGSTFEFVIGVPNTDPQSDAFHGIWEELSASTGLNLSGSGTGTVRGQTISGTFSGEWNFYQSFPTATQVTYCSAADHAFTMTTQ